MTSPFQPEVHHHRTNEPQKRSTLLGQRDVETTGDTWQTQGVGYVLLCQVEWLLAHLEVISDSDSDIICIVSEN